MRKILYLILVVIVLFSGCDNNEGNLTGKLVVRLTDSPAMYEEVLIDVQELYIHNGDSGWMELPLEITGQVDLLELSNGKDILLTEKELPVGKISQMRMVLGDNNEIKINGEYHHLETPSALQSGLKFNIHAAIEPGVTYEMWIDFVAANSVVENGNGEYALKPTIRVFTEATSGSIIGFVDPAEAKPLVQAITATEDTISTFADEKSGEFVLRGLDADIYKVVFEPIPEYEQVEIENVEVTIGAATDLDTINIPQVSL